MLVLSRKLNESIMIEDNIEITIVEIRGDKVRLGFDAPKNVSIHKREVYEAIVVEKFKGYLREKNYKDAYNSLIKLRNYKPSSEELSKLVNGLREKGQFDKSIEDKLIEQRINYKI